MRHDAFTTEHKFEIEHRGRIFEGTAECEWVGIPASRGYRNSMGVPEEPDSPAYAELQDVSLLEVFWVTPECFTDIFLKRGDRNWHRMKGLMKELRSLVIEEFQDLQPEVDCDE